MTDIWGWTFEKERELRKRGEHALADVMDNIPSWTCGGDHHRVDAEAEAAIIRAREISEAWVEIFLRHWRLQSLVSRRADVRASHAEAASLLEFATRPGNRDCPQSVCAVQDFCIAFGKKEGHAYARERIEIVEGCFAEINPRVSCYSCLSTELHDAYLDLDEVDKSEDFLLRTGKHVAVGMAPEELGHNYDSMLAAIALRRRDFGLVRTCAARLDADAERRGDDAIACHARCLRARASAYEGDAAEALKQLEPWDDVLGRPDDFREEACEAILTVAGTGLPDGADPAFWAGRVERAIRDLARLGQSYPSLDLGSRAAPFIARALGGGAALAMLEAVEPELAELKEPERVRGRFEAAKRAASEEAAAVTIPAIQRESKV